MLAPRASSAFVCIRCELQLARRRIPSYKPRTSCASFSASVRRRGGLEELEAELEPKESAPGITKVESQERRQERPRRRKGRNVQAVSASLEGLKRLGEDATVLVIKDNGARPKPQEVTIEEDESLGPQQVPNILEQLYEERARLDPDEINDRLDSLQPKADIDSNEPHYLPRARFARLTRDLVKGFTTQQLSRYYSARKTVSQRNVSKDIIHNLKGESSDPRGVVARSVWQSGKTPMATRLPPQVLASRAPRKPVSKQLLVDRVLREVWSLVPQEEDEVMGEIELQLKPWQLALLQTGDKETVLSRIAAARRAKVELFSPDNTLRITADKTTAEYAAADIEEALTTTSSRKLHLKSWIPHLAQDKVPEDQKLATLYTEEDFEVITSLTCATIQRMDNKNTLVIRGLNENAVNDAERMLVSLLPHKSTAQSSMDIEDVVGPKKAVALIPCLSEESSVDYRHRKVMLGRWALPVKPSSSKEETGPLETEPQKNTVIIDSKIERVFDALKGVHRTQQKTQRDELDSAESRYWTAPSYELHALFGQAMFPPITADQLKTKGTTSSKPVFVANTPGLPTLLADPDVSFPSRAPTRILQYNFIAAPEQQNLDTTHSPPPLRIQISTDTGSGKVDLDKLSLHLHEFEHTILLPNQASDMRFTTSGTLTLRKEQVQDKNVQEWLDAVRANIASGDRLSAPPLTLTIPRWTMQGEKTNVKGLSTVKYLFSTIQSQQSIMGTFSHRTTNETANDTTNDEITLSYTTIQANKLSASSSSFRMHFHPNSTTNVSNPHTLFENEPAMKRFLESCLAFVERLSGASMQRVPIVKVLRPRSDESERKARRAGRSNGEVEEGEGTVEDELREG